MLSFQFRYIYHYYWSISCDKVALDNRIIYIYILPQFRNRNIMQRVFEKDFYVKQMILSISAKLENNQVCVQMCKILGKHFA